MESASEQDSISPKHSTRKQKRQRGPRKRKFRTNMDLNPNGDGKCDEHDPDLENLLREYEDYEDEDGTQRKETKKNGNINPENIHVCHVCNSKPQLHPEYLKFCALCFAQKIELKRTNNPNKFLRDNHEDPLVHLRPMLIDLPYNRVPLTYATRKYYGRQGQLRRERNFVINKFSEMLIITQNQLDGTINWFCCKNRVDALNMDECRMILAQQLGPEAAGAGPSSRSHKERDRRNSDSQVSKPKQLPLCPACNSKSQLHPEYVKLCAICFAHDIELKRTQKSWKALHDNHENPLVHLRPMLIDLPYQPIDVIYACKKYYDKLELPNQSVSKQERNFMIDKFAELLIVTRSRSNVWFCCKNRVDALDMNECRKMLEQELGTEVAGPNSRSESEEEQDRPHSDTVVAKPKQLPMCPSCNSKPQLHPEFVKVCASCFAHDIELKRAQKASFLLHKNHDDRLVQFRPMLLDLPYQHVDLMYACKKYYGRQELSDRNISEPERNFVIDKFAELWIINPRKGYWACCKNRVDALNLDECRKILELGTNRKELPLCPACNSKPGLHRRCVKLCAKCFVGKIEYKRAKKMPGQILQENCGNELLKFRRKLVDLPYARIHLGYALTKYYGRQKRVSTEERNFLIDKFSELLIITGSKSKRYCCKNRVDDLNMKKCRRILEKAFRPGIPSSRSQEIQEQERPPKPKKLSRDEIEHNRYLKFVDYVVNGYPTRKKRRAAAKLKASQLNTTEEHTQDSEISSTSEIIRRDEIDEDQAMDDENESLEVPHDHDESSYQVEEHSISSESDGVRNSAAKPTSDSDSEVESILTPKRKSGIFLDDSDEEKIRSTKRIRLNKTKTGPASKTRKQPSKCNPSFGVKNYPRATRCAPRSYAENSDTDSDFNLTSSSESSDSETETDNDSSSNDSDGSSVISSSQASEKVDSEIEILSEDEEDPNEPFFTDPEYQPLVILETNAAAEAKLKEAKLSAQDRKDLERERQDYEDEVLGKIQFSQCSLDYAIGVISEALNWNVFPFGANVLNRGNITYRQRKNPNNGEWLQIKQEFVRSRFKTALSITPHQGNWYCCRNRVDALDFKEYLQRFWKIAV